MAAKKRLTRVIIDDNFHMSVLMSYGRNAHNDYVGLWLSEGRLDSETWVTPLQTVTKPMSPQHSLCEWHDDWMRDAWRHLEEWYANIETRPQHE
jgi:hypothetical protein